MKYRSLPSSMSSRDLHSNDQVPDMLAAAWAVCTPADKPLREQLNTQEKNFLISLAQYILTALSSPLSSSDPDTVLGDILMTARHRLSLLSKEVTLSPGYVVIMTLLQLLANLYSADNMKYSSVEHFIEIYPGFAERSTIEKEKLFHTANWMHILFQITTAKKNKGLVMAIIPKFVEGNGAQYVTGSGQTQPTRDRVTIYETEGNVKPTKRLHRKSKQEIMDLAKQNNVKNKKNTKTKKKATYVKRKTFSDGSCGSGRASAKKKPTSPVVVRPRSSRTSARTSVRLSHSPSVQFISGEEFDDDEEQEEPMEEQQETFQSSASETDASSLRNGDDTNLSGSGNYQQYLPLPLPLSFNMAPPIPVRRSQSSFSQAAALIASFSSAATAAPASYVKSPREFYLDVEPNGSLRKTSSCASWGSLTSLGSCSPRGGGTESVSLSQQALSDQPYQDQLKMLREVSEDSDFSTQEQSIIGGDDSGGVGNNLLPPHLIHQQSLSLSIPGTIGSNSTSGSSGLGSPNPQPRTLERCPTSSLDEQGEVDFELLEEMTRQVGHSWLGMGVGVGMGLSLSRSTSASSLPGRDSTPTVAAQ